LSWKTKRKSECIQDFDVGGYAGVFFLFPEKAIGKIAEKTRGLSVNSRKGIERGCALEPQGIERFYNAENAILYLISLSETNLAPPLHYGAIIVY
jgi:hypothetical protein